MRYEHYKRVVQWDLIQRFPYRTQRDNVPKIQKVTIVWSLIGLGFQSQYVPAAWTALNRISGQIPQVLYTKKSVAQRRLKEGDPVGCIVTITGKDAYDRIEQWLVRVFPEMRPFYGYDVKRNITDSEKKEENDTKFKRSVSLSKQNTVMNKKQSLASSDSFYPQTSDGLQDIGHNQPKRKTTGIVDIRGQVTFHMEQPGVIPSRTPFYESYFQLVTGSSGSNSGGRYISLKTSASTKEEGVALLEGRRFPIR